MSEVSPPQPAEPSPRRRGLRSRAARLMAGLLLAYLVGAYVMMPAVWKRYVRRHPALDDVPGITQTAAGIPGDPLNVALVGDEADVNTIMQAAGWDAAAALGLRSDLQIAADTVLRRPDEKAPVSNLYLFGRKEDLAFEQPVGGDPHRRHHVRFWRADKPDAAGRPLWLGSATYDERVGLSHTTGQITHHIAPDVDAERDHLMLTLQQTGQLSGIEGVDGFHKILAGRNGGGDPWHTDGRLAVGVITQPAPAADSAGALPPGKPMREQGTRCAGLKPMVCVKQPAPDRTPSGAGSG
jgi:hypothetical protein